MLNKKHAAFSGRLVITGFGSIGPGVLPLLLRHLEFDPGQVTIITAEPRGHGGAAEYGVHFIQAALTRENYRALIDSRAGGGGLLLNVPFAVSCFARRHFCAQP